MKNVYEEITNKIVEQLESVDSSFQLPWNSVAGGMPHNIVSKKAYRGINIPLLMLTGFSSPVWATYKQWADKGYQVQKGEKGTQIVFWKPIKKSEVNAEGNTEDKSFLLAKTYTVFNAEQTDYEVPAVEVNTEFNNIEAAEAFVANTGAKLQHGGNQAFYAPSRDLIQMPEKYEFISEEGYYSTLLHELTHWTGSKTRCNRSKGMASRFGSESYAAEELVAELGAAFLCADLQITPMLREDHSKYIKSWIKVLKNDNKAIFTAASKAQEACDMLHSMQEENKVAQAA